MKRFLITLLFVSILNGLYGQVMFVERFELEVKYQENNFFLIPIKEGLLAFRSQPERAFNLKSNLQYFITDFELQSDKINAISIREGFELIGFDVEGDFFYVLFQKGFGAVPDRYMIEINLKSQEAREINLENVLSMEIREFFVLNRSAVFMGVSEMRPVVQLFDIEVKRVFTVQGLYFRDTKILQLRKDSELQVLDALVSRRNQFKQKEIFLSTFDDQGNRIREVIIDKLDNPDTELIEGVLTPIKDYQQSIIGTFGVRRREAYQGIYLADINEFGEYEIKYYTLEDMVNFYSYLNEKQAYRKNRDIEKTLAKGKIPTIKPVFTAREVYTDQAGYLIYSENFIPTNTRYIQRDGSYSNYAFRNYRQAAPWGMWDPMMNTWQNPNLFMGPSRMISPWQQLSEYKFISSYFVYMSKEGEIIWENSLDLDGMGSNQAGKFGEISFDGRQLHFLYLDGKQIRMSYMLDGQVMFENEPFEIELVNEEERLRDTQIESLSLMWWFSNYYLLSGKQKIRFLNEEGKEALKEVFFITKIKVDGDQFVPEGQDSNP